MSEIKKEYIQAGYDNVRQAYIIRYYENGRYICSYTGYLNHKTREFKCYPRELARSAMSQKVIRIHETQLERQPTG